MFDAEVVEQAERVAGHGVVVVRGGIVRLVGLAVAAGVERDHAPSGGDERVDDAGRDPVDLLVGREPVQQQHVGTFARGRVRDADPVERREAIHGSFPLRPLI